MNFVSYEFCIFLAVVWGMFLVTPAKLRWVLLLAAGYVFYAAWSIPFIAVIIVSTTVDYAASIIIYQSKSQRVKQLALALAIAINILILCLFKYLNLILEAHFNACSIFKWSSTLPRELDIFLPIGISYYTFEAISYVVDVYRGQKPAPDWLKYSFYIMYFPHLIAGPIVRFSELWSQYEFKIDRPSPERVRKGFELLVLGFFFKTVIADSFIWLIDPVYANPEAATVLGAYTAALAFCVQLYMDFLGYSHIARGSSLLFNIELPINFNHPYSATSFSDFWERWQISLSRWLRDYIYKPLGGSKKTIQITILNTLIVFAIAGIWHGATATFILYGIQWGVVSALYVLWKHYRKPDSNPQQNFNSKIKLFAARSITFIIVASTIALFRAQSLDSYVGLVRKLSDFRGLAQELAHTGGLLEQVTVLSCVTCLVIIFGGPTAVKLYDRSVSNWPYWAKVQAATAVALCCWVMSANQVKPFIYFQF